MYEVKPIFYCPLWGDHRLLEYGSNQKNTGIIYTVSGIDSINCQIKNENEITTLKEKTDSNPELFGLLPGECFPVIIAFDSCKESVSFQIHPTDEYAREKLSLPYGKSEAWYFIESPEQNWIYAQTKKEDIQEDIENNSFDFVDKIDVKENDLIYIRSGMVHALTKGSLIYEIQQSTNITYRLYDYDRIDPITHKKRELHIQQALENLNPSLKVDQKNFPVHSQGNYREFSLVHTILKDSYTNESTIVCAISVLKGTLIVNHIKIDQGKSILVLPEETITIQQEAEVMIAICHPYFRNI